jgi:hypothetical protein
LEADRSRSGGKSFDRCGYLIFERVLPQNVITEIRAALQPHLARDLKGRNDFEGVKTNRVYALLAKSPVFAGLVDRGANRRGYDGPAQFRAMVG